MAFGMKYMNHEPEVSDTRSLAFEVNFYTSFYVNLRLYAAFCYFFSSLSMLIQQSLKELLKVFLFTNILFLNEIIIFSFHKTHSWQMKNRQHIFIKIYAT